MLLTSMRGQAMTYALQPDAPRDGPHVQHWQAVVEAFGPSGGGRPMTRVGDHRRRLRRARRRRPAKQAGFATSCSSSAPTTSAACGGRTPIPGAACDVALAPLLAVVRTRRPTGRGGSPRRRRSTTTCSDVARDFDVLRHVRFRTEVLAAAFDEERGTWRLTLSGGEEHEADVLIAATGQLSRPSTPAVPGLERLRGHDVPLGAVGPRPRPHRASGSPSSAPAPARSSSCPRSPAARRPSRSSSARRPTCCRKPDRAYRERAKKAFARVPGLLRLSRRGHLPLQRARGRWASTPSPGCCSPTGPASAGTCARWCPTRRCGAKLTPTDPMGCKRILMSNDWYQALQLPQVEVVTDADRARCGRTRSSPPTAPSARSTRSCSAPASRPPSSSCRCGSPAGTAATCTAVEGRRERLPGTVVPGFPNFFVLYGPNTNLGHNSILVMLEAQIGWVVQAVRALRQGRVRRLEVRADVAAAFDAWVQERVGAHGLRRRLPQLVPHRERPQHPELAGLHADLPPPAAPAAAGGVPRRRARRPIRRRRRSAR